LFLEALAASIIGGILCLDRIFLQVMVSRPVVAGTLTGFSGALVELLWIDRSPFGTVIPPNDSIASIIIAASTIISGKILGHSSRELIAVAVLLFIPLGILGKQIDILVMGANEKVSRDALDDAEAGRDEEISRKQISGLIKTFLLTFFFLLGFILIATEILLRVYPVIPPKLHLSIMYVYFFLPLLGIAIALSTVRMRGMMPVFCGLFLIMTVIFDVL
jgi:mannose/fructose/N-acetylgalactosamine-specific phosphotransferase system component IIC